MTFYNRVKLGMVKVCKVIPMTSQDSLGMQGLDVRGGLQRRPARDDRPDQGRASAPRLGRPHPILDFEGTHDVTISENVPTGQARNVTYTIDSITCTGCRPTVVFPFQEVIHFNLGPGTNVVTYHQQVEGSLSPANPVLPLAGGTDPDEAPGRSGASSSRWRGSPGAGDGSRARTADNR